MPVHRKLERAVKRRVTEYLLSLQQPNSPVRCYFRMPVPYGYGTSGLDYEGCIEGYYFNIETKSPTGGEMTPRQRATAKRVIDGGGKVFIISCEEGFAAFKRWAEQCKPA